MTEKRRLLAHREAQAVAIAVGIDARAPVAPDVAPLIHRPREREW